eukprot:CAMPEP_0119429754 /NCGR_PEP_ID=MMETSP1335-20130426/42795_1 /TAXON_ID=259385 /ORGANISM="Chrysoculter rhomboideus, Strain RCC1486" /LENGTH=157 /DNA_ID=CAMNT_0007455489 /DNA_START=113 /DNA_END=588 /DNA_ORIENTATION=+
MLPAPAAASSAWRHTLMASAAPDDVGGAGAAAAGCSSSHEAAGARSPARLRCLPGDAELLSSGGSYRDAQPVAWHLGDQTALVVTHDAAAMVELGSARRTHSKLDQRATTFATLVVLEIHLVAAQADGLLTATGGADELALAIDHLALGAPPQANMP